MEISRLHCDKINIGGDDVSFKPTDTTANAVIAAFSALSVRRIGVVAPYIKSVCNVMTQYLKNHGFTVSRSFTFDKTQESDVVGIDSDVIFDEV